MSSENIVMIEEKRIETCHHVSFHGTGHFIPSLLQVVIFALVWVFDAQHTHVTIFTDAQPSWHCTHNVNVSHLIEICTAQSSICEMDPSLWEWERGKQVSVISQQNLVCADTIQAGFPSLFFFMGSLLGEFLGISRLFLSIK